jgi:hypothetical protein
MAVSGRDPQLSGSKFPFAWSIVKSAAPICAPYLCHCGNIDREHSTTVGFAMMVGFYVVKMTGSPFIVAIVFP